MTKKLRGSAPNPQPKQMPKPRSKQRTNLPPIGRELAGMLRGATMAPAAIGRRVAMSKPSFRPAPNGSTVVTHCEFISVVSSAGTFTATRIPVNPGLGSTFAWLSNVASNYDRYRFRKLAFYYVPAVSTAQAGRMCLAFSFDANQPLPTTNQQMFSICPNDEETLWQELAISVPCVDKTKYYVRTVGTNPNMVSPNGGSFVQDLKTTDPGVLFYSTNYASDSNCGELYVSYEIELFDPTAAGSNPTGELSSSTSSITSIFPTPGTTQLGTAIADTNISNAFAFTAGGTYLVTLKIVGTVVTNTAPTLTALTGALTSSNPTGWYANSVTSAGQGLFIVVVTADPATGTCNAYWTFTGSASTITAVNLYAVAAASLPLT